MNNKTKISQLLSETSELLSESTDLDLKKSYELYKNSIKIEITTVKEFDKLVRKYTEDAIRSCYYTQFNFKLFDDYDISYREFKKNFKNDSKPKFESFENGDMMFRVYKYLETKNIHDGSYKREIPMEIIFEYCHNKGIFRWSFDGSD